MRKKVIVMLSLFVFMYVLAFLISFKQDSDKKIKIIKKINVVAKARPNKSYFSYVVKEPVMDTSISSSVDDEVNTVNNEVNDASSKEDDLSLDSNVKEETNDVTKDEEETTTKESEESKNDTSLASSLDGVNKVADGEASKEDENIKSVTSVSTTFASSNPVTETKKEGYYSPSGKYLGDSNVKVIDVSYYQGDIDWDTFVRDSNCYGVILRIGYWNMEDVNFKNYIEAVKRLNIPYGIYIFSYAGNSSDAKIESDFTNMMIDKYALTPTLGIYYDIESWKVNDVSSDDLTQNDYDDIVNTFVNNVSMHVSNSYKVGVYASTWYALNRLGDASRNYVSWVAEWNNNCNYPNSYTLWQYTSDASEPGINGPVDESYLK